MARCEVSSKCALTAYVTVWANGASAEAMQPFRTVTRTCRRHVSMLIDHATIRSVDVRIRRVD